MPKDNPSLMLDDFWGSILEPFADHPSTAFIFAQALHQLRHVLRSGPQGILEVIKVLESGIETLYPYTDVHHAGFKLYLLAVEGKLLPKHDPTIVVRELEPKP
jgi:hypothetical protein